LGAFFPNFQEVLEQGTKMHHGLTQILRVRAPLGGVLRDRVGHTIVPDDPRMIDGDVGDTLLELSDGVPASPHQVLDEAIALLDGAGRIVDEARLRLTPGAREASGLVTGQRNDVQRVDALAASLEV
jgi:hypothetical protein